MRLSPSSGRRRHARLFSLCLPRNLMVLALAAIALLASGCGNVLLDERFYDSRLRNWTAIDDPETLEAPSEWAVGQDGWLHQKSNIWGRPGDFLGRWYGTMLVAGDPSWADYSIRVKAKPVDDDGFGVLFRFNDREHYYRLLFIQDGLNGGPLTRLDKRDGADYTEILSLKRGYRPGSELVIELDVIEDNIRGRVDGQTLFDVRDGRYRRGSVGLFCFAQNGQAFDDVRVESR